MKQKKPTAKNVPRSVVFSRSNPMATDYIDIAVETARIAATVSDQDKARALGEGVEMATAKARYADIRNTIGPALRFIELAAKCEKMSLARRLGGIEQQIKAGFDEADKVYDTFLKVNKQESGIKSYGECVDMLVTWMMRKGMAS